MLLNFLLCCAKRFVSCEVALQFGEKCKSYKKYVESNEKFSPLRRFFSLHNRVSRKRTFLISTRKCWKLPLEAIQTLPSIPEILLFSLGPSRSCAFNCFHCRRCEFFDLTPMTWIPPVFVNCSLSCGNSASINTFLSPPTLSLAQGNLILNQLPFI